MQKNNASEYAINAEGANNGDIMLKSTDQELIFGEGNDD